MDGKDSPMAQAMSGTSELLAPLHAALLNVAEPERYRLIASLLLELAESSQASTSGQDTMSTEQAEAMAKKIQAIDQERATLDDALKTSRADLARSSTQLEAEQTRGRELQEIIDDQSVRLKTLQDDQSNMEAEVVAKNAALHKLEVAKDELTLRVQRAEIAGKDTSKADAIELGKRDLTRQVEELKEQMEQFRQEKDADLEKLKEELRGSKASASDGGDALLAGLWERLANANPSLGEGHVTPTTQSVERLVDAFIELVRFVHDFDQSMRVFLTRYTHYQATVRVPWEAYARGDDLLTVARRTVAPKGGRPVGILKMRLRLLYSWTEAAMIGSDSAIESIASELEAYLRGPDVLGSDPKKTVREFIHPLDGPEKFIQQMRELRSTKLADAFGRGG